MTMNFRTFLAIVGFSLSINCAIPAINAQSEVIHKFLRVNRTGLLVSAECDNDLKIVENSLAENEIWALKCECVKSE